MRTHCLVLVAAILGWAAAWADTPYTIRTFAGSNYSGDGGAATAALIGQAEGIVVDPAGNVYVADAADHRVRKITPAGAISTVAGTGQPGFSGDGGPASSALLNTPYGLVLDRSGNLYVADLGNARVRRIAGDGLISTVAGGGIFGGEGGLATDTLLNTPRNVAVDASGNLYISDFGEHYVYIVDPSGTLHYFAGTGQSGFRGDNGFATAAQLSYPAGLAVDSQGTVYIADSGNKRVRKVTSGKTISSVTVAGTLPALYVPTGVATDSANNLYIADGRIDQLPKINAIGTLTAVPVGGWDVAVDAAGNAYTTSSLHVNKCPAGGSAQVLAGSDNFSFFGEGTQAAIAKLNLPASVAVDAAGNVYIADTGNNRIRKVTPAGIITTVAGTGSHGYSGDGLAAIGAALDAPLGVAADANGNLYIADTGNDRIRKVNSAGIITTIAGSGLRGYSGDNDLAIFAEVDSPSALALDSAGDLLISDTGNNAIRQINPAGIMQPVAGNGKQGSSGDGGPATQGELDAPRGITVDTAGNLYIADSGNARIREVTAAGLITTLGTAAWVLPYGVAATPQGDIIVTDAGNQRVRRVNAAGVAGTLAGNGTQGFSGDEAPALLAQLNGPQGVAIDSSGSIYFADTGNNRVRTLSQDSAAVAPPALTSATITNAASFQPGPVAPGELVSIFASGMGVNPTVLFGGTPAYVTYASDGQINAQVPYEIAGQASVPLAVRVNGTEVLSTPVSVATAAPGIFANNGSGQAAAINADGTLNSLDYPADRNSIVTLYATGEGQTTPGGVTGQPAAAPYPTPLKKVAALIGGNSAEVVWAGEAPGFVGLLQVNVRIPGGYAPSGTLPVTLSVGGAASQSGVTIVVR